MALPSNFFLDLQRHTHFFDAISHSDRSNNLGVIRMAVLVLRTCLLLEAWYKLTFGTLLKSIKFVRQLAIGYGLIALIWGHF